MALSLRSALRAGGLAEFALIAYAVLYLGLPPFTLAAILVVGGIGAILAIMSKQPTIQVAGISLAGVAILALLALPSLAFLGAGLIAIFIALFGGVR